MTLRKLVAEGKFSGSALVSIDDARATFVCDCGSEFSRSLRNSTKTSTVRCLSCTNSRPFVGERHVFKRIKSDAKKAGREFNLSIDFFIDMCHRPCHYCNRVDINSTNIPSKANGFLIEGFRYNGLDRVDNAIGYVEDNCVPCCVVCNRAKQSMSLPEFMEYLEALVGHQNSIGEVNNERESLHSERIYDRSGSNQAGEHSGNEGSLEDDLPVYLVGFDGQELVGRNSHEWSRGFSGGAYRNIERTAQA